ncbi:hypothetical protein KQI65_10415 [bacterium]|nr:hypothetical protein [bacterium]
MLLRNALLLVLFPMLLCSCGQENKKAEMDVKSVTDSGGDESEQMLTADDRGASIALDAPVSLTYHFTRGDRFGYAFTSLQQVNLYKDSVAEKNRQEIRHWYRFEVLEAAEGGGGRLRVTCDRVTFHGSYEAPDGKNELDYDSDADNSYEVEKRFAEHNAPVDAPFEITVDPDGRISSVSKLDSVVKNYLRDDYGTTRKSDIESIKQAISVAKLKAVLQLAFQKLADHPVAKDSTWQIVRPETLGYLAKEDVARYTVKDIVSSPKGRVAHIAVHISSRYTGDKTFDTGQGMATMDTFDVTAGGITVFNMLHGRMQRRNLRTDVNVRMYVEPPDELKELAPEQAKNFWWTQKAYTEDRIEPYSPTTLDN